MIFYNRSKHSWDVRCFWNIELVNIENNNDISDTKKYKSFWLMSGLEEMVAYCAWPFFQEAYSQPWVGF